MTPVNDVQNAGVDWTVTCGGNPKTGSITGGACGSFSPTHTSNGGTSSYTAPAVIPVGTNVTLIASVTSDPQAASTVTLPVVPPAISLAFTNAPNTVPSGATVLYEALAINDTSGAGVTFTATCSNAPCGSFSNVEANLASYTAPSVIANEAVTISATSVTQPTLSISVSVTIVPIAAVGPNPVAVSLSPTSFYATRTGAARNATLTATVTNDPTPNAGVTFSLTCGSTAANACGTVLPGTAVNDVTTAKYTSPSALPPAAVTITATSVSTLSASASSTATIVTKPPIVISWTSSATQPPSSLAEGVNVKLAASASPLGAAINWTATCGGTDCGTFTSATTGQPISQTSSGGAIDYTAPSSIPPGGVVTIEAASAATTPSNYVGANVSITTPAPAIAIVQQPPATIAASTQVPVTATVTNDSSPGGVTWSVPQTCGSTVPGGCGWVVPYATADGATATYVAPPVAPSGSVTIVATSASTSFNPLTASSTPVTIVAQTAVGISFVPFAPSQLAGYATVNLTAAASNDPANAGVDWSVCGDTCGFFTTLAAVPAIAATATTPFVPAIPAVTATSVQGWPNGLAIPYTAPIATNPGGSVAINIAAHASPGATASASVAIVNSLAGPALTGTVQVGGQPVAAAQIALYAAGTSGYGSPATLLYRPGGSSYTATSSSGSFTVAGGYTCPSPGSEVYVVALGGTIGTAAPNPNRSLMTVLGPCSNLGSTPVYLNEVTTIGSVWPLAPFAPNQPLNGTQAYPNIGTSSSNTAGLVGAFAAVNNLVDITTGQVRYFVPAGDAAIPYAEINTLADMLNSCASSTGGSYDDGSTCGQLFFDTATLGNGGVYSATVPNDTIQAAMNVAQEPYNAGVDNGYTLQIPELYQHLVSLQAPFQPILDAAPGDFSISLTFSGVGGLSGTSGAQFLAVDALNNLWMTDALAGRVIEWNNLGAGISPATGYAAGGISSPGPLAIDASGDVWISGGNGLTELYSVGTPAQGSPFKGGDGGTGMAIDGVGNIWMSNGAGVVEFNHQGQMLSPSSGFTYPGIANIGPVAVDDLNNVWIASETSGATFLTDLYNATGQPQVSVAGNPASGLPPQLAIDASGNTWFGAGDFCKVPAYGGLGTLEQATCLNIINNSYLGIASPGAMALDGAGMLWIANLGNASISPNLSDVLLAGAGNSESNVYAAPAFAAGAQATAVDGAGNVWVLVGNNTVTEFVGIATPTVQPLALAVKNKKLAAKP